MPRRSSTGHESTVIARRIVEQAVREDSDGTPLRDPERGKNPHAVALGRMGGKKRGKARAAKLSSRKLRAIAKKAALARRHKKGGVKS